MKSTANNFRPYYIESSVELEGVVKQNIEDKETSYYLFLNSWDKPCLHFQELLANAAMHGGPQIVSVVDVYDIPNGLGILRSAIQEATETVSTSAIRNYTKLPMLVIMHRAFPRVVDYGETIAAELGV